MSAAPTIELVACALCGHRFDPTASDACSSCPLGRGCSLVCCPECGYSVPDASRSAFAGLAGRFARRRRSADGPLCALAHAAPGCQATIETLEHVPARQREQLLAYGVAPGRIVDVLQTRPVTVIRVEHAELALENAIGRLIGITGGS